MRNRDELNKIAKHKLDDITKICLPIADELRNDYQSIFEHPDAVSLVSIVQESSDHW